MLLEMRGLFFASLCVAAFGISLHDGNIQIVKRSPINVKDLPQHVLEIGIKAYGSKDGVVEALENTSDIVQSVYSGIPVKFVSASVDNTIKRLNFEMANSHKDRYGLRQISTEEGVIVDLGANIGDFAITAALMYPKFHVIALEPSPHTFFYFVLNCWLNNVPMLEEKDAGNHHKPGVLAWLAAATTDGHDVEIKWSDANSQNAAVGANGISAQHEHWSSAMVPSIQMEKYFAKNHIEQIELFKIDCEGCEFDVIPAMRDIFVDRNKIKKVKGEVHQNCRKKMVAARGYGIYVNKTQGDLFDEVMKARGCFVTNFWEIKKC